MRRIYTTGSSLKKNFSVFGTWDAMERWINPEL
jgi:hypothetical protein